MPFTKDNIEQIRKTYKDILGIDANISVERKISVKKMYEYFAQEENNQSKALVMVSGGKDSTVTLGLACEALSKMRNMRNDFLHKLTSVLVNNFKYIAVEKLNVAGMLKNHKLAKALSTVSFYEFKRMLAYKASFNHRQLIEAEPFYPSSKTCSRCGKKKDELSLSDRVYKCDCGLELDRDYNASLNLFNLISSVGAVRPEYTPVDLEAMLSDLLVNQLVTSKVETGIQLREIS